MGYVGTERGEEDPVRLYLHDIGQYPLLTKDDEARLAQAIEARSQAGQDLQAKDARLNRTAPPRTQESRTARGRRRAALRAVQPPARRKHREEYQASGLPLLDLIQDGNLGLIHAVEKFDWRKGSSSPPTRHGGSAGDYTRHREHRADDSFSDPCGRPRHARAEGARTAPGKARPSRDARRARDRVGLAEDKITEVLRFPGEPLSLSTPLREDGDAELGDVVEDRLAESPFEAAALALLPDEIARLLAPLDEREREILRLRFGLDRGEPERSKRSGSTSTSPVSGSDRSRLSRCPSFVIPRAMWVHVTC